jgi:hypothetical protein
MPEDESSSVSSVGIARALIILTQIIALIRKNQETDQLNYTSQKSKNKQIYFENLT